MEQAVRQEIAREVSIILDSLRKENPEQVLGTVKARLERMTLRDGEKVLRPLDWLPQDNAFWMARDESWTAEIRYWEQVRPLFEPIRQPGGE